jgi:hypothetical protein
MIPTPSIGTNSNPMRPGISPSAPGATPGMSPGMAPAAPGMAPAAPGMAPAAPGITPAAAPRVGQGAAQGAAPAAGTEIEPPKCFGTDYFGKWNATGMTFESMKIDRPEQQTTCANCSLFGRCYQLSHIRLLRIKH